MTRLLQPLVRSPSQGKVSATPPARQTTAAFLVMLTKSPGIWAMI